MKIKSVCFFLLAFVCLAQAGKDDFFSNSNKIKHFYEDLSFLDIDLERKYQNTFNPELHTQQEFQNALDFLEKGLFFEKGKGRNAQQNVQPDLQTAFTYYSWAAEYNLAMAQFKMGFMYIKGHGVEKNLDEAEKWLKKAGDQGYAEALVDLGWIYAVIKKDDPQAGRFYRSAARQGIPRAQFYMGLMLQNGWGVDPDLRQAVKWYKKIVKNSKAPVEIAKEAQNRINESQKRIINKKNNNCRVFWKKGVRQTNPLVSKGY